MMMEYDEFIGLVQNRAKLASSGEAMRAIHATLNVFEQRLFGDQAEHLAAQLPPEIGYCLREDLAKASFGLDEFFTRVAHQEGVALPDAMQHARAVISVLQEAVTPGVMQHAREQLPDEWDMLFEAGSEGKMDMPD